MMADSQVSVGEALFYARLLFRQHWRSIWGVLALTSLAMTVYTAGAFVQNPNIQIVGGVALLLAQPMLYGAVFRVAFADRHPADPAFTPGHSGLQWRALEWRVLAASLLVTLLLLICAALGAVLVGALALGVIMNRSGGAPPATPEAALAALGPDGQRVVQLMLLVVLGAMAYLYVRLSLALAATADTGKIKVLQSWPLTKGRSLRIFTALFVLQLPFFLVQIAVTALADSGRGGLAAAPQMTAESALFAALAIGTAFGALIAPLSASVLAYFYRSSGAAPAGERPDGRP